MRVCRVLVRCPSRLQPASVRKHRALCRTGSDHDVLCRTAQRLGRATRDSGDWTNHNGARRDRHERRTSGSLCLLVLITSAKDGQPWLPGLRGDTRVRVCRDHSVRTVRNTSECKPGGGVRICPDGIGGLPCEAGVVALARSLKSGDTALTTANYWHYLNAAWVVLLGFVYISR